GVGDLLLGRAVVYDGLRTTFREVRYERDPAAEPIAGLIDYELFCGGRVAEVPEEASVAAPGTRAVRLQRSGGAVTNRELQDLLERGEPITLIDVREPWEAQLASIPGSALVPLGELEADLDEDAEGVATALR